MPSVRVTKSVVHPLSVAPTLSVVPSAKWGSARLASLEESLAGLREVWEVVEMADECHSRLLGRSWLFIVADDKEEPRGDGSLLKCI